MGLILRGEIINSHISYQQSIEDRSFPSNYKDLDTEDEPLGPPRYDGSLSNVFSGSNSLQKRGTKICCLADRKESEAQVLEGQAAQEDLLLAEQLEIEDTERE